MTYAEMMLCLQLIAEEKVGASLRTESRAEDAKFDAGLAALRKEAV